MSANSIIQIYQNPSTANTLTNEVLSATTSVNKSRSAKLRPGSQISPLQEKSSSFVFNSIDNLPTASPHVGSSIHQPQNTSSITDTSRSSGKGIDSSKKARSRNAGNRSSSLFSIPSRLFSLKKKKNVGAATSNNVISSGALGDATPIDIISDSPVGDLVNEDTVDHSIDQEERSSGIGNCELRINDTKEELTDQVYETYIRYVYHTQENETIVSDEEEPRFTDSATIVETNVDRDAQMIDEVAVGNINNASNQNNQKQEVKDTGFPREFNFQSFKTKTKSFLKQLSTHYENEIKNFNESSIRPKKDELKRRLSGYSIRHSSPIKRFKNNSFAHPDRPGHHSFKGRGERDLLALFDSAEFNQRLGEGSVRSRTRNPLKNGISSEVNNEDDDEYDEDDDDENYHISYKLNHTVTERVISDVQNHGSFSPRRILKKLSIRRHNISRNDENVA